MNKIGLSGHFDIVKKDKYGNVIDEYHFDNLILNSGLDLIGNKQARDDYDRFSFLSYCFVGSGNSEPNVTQRNLDNQIAYNSSYTSDINKTLNDNETSVSYVKKFRFDENTANGNISEIGIGTNTILFCRTLIKDPSGRHTVITKLQGEILEVTYTLKVVVDTKDSTGVVQIGDKQYNYIARLARNNNSTYYTAIAHDGNIGNIDNEPRGNYQYISRRFGNYTNNQYKIEINVFANIDQANFGTGIRSIQARGLFDWWWQIQFNAVDDNLAIPKNNTQKLNIVFEQSWGRKE